MDTKILNALSWITDLLKSQHVPFQITGGFAAHLYGSNRPVADIDLDIPEEKMETLLPFIKPYIVFGPGQYKDDHWDLKLVTLEYEGQEIDLGGAYEARVFNKRKNSWDLVHVDFKTSKMMQIGSVQFPVVNLEHLIEYKKKLAREVDLMDIEALEA